MVYKYSNHNIDMKIDTARHNAMFKRAISRLDTKILADSTPYVPFQTGNLRSQGHIVDDGVIEWNTPYAHYQYYGVQYIDPNLGVSGILGDEGWFCTKGVTKEKTDKPLNYSQPDTGDHWFERAKKEHLKEWMKLVADVSGGTVEKNTKKKSLNDLLKERGLL